MSTPLTAVISDPAKEDTSLFFFRDDPGAEFAICSAAGVDLPKTGITGHSRFMFQKRNNAVIAGHIEV